MLADQLLDFMLKHFRTLMFPEEWIELDLALSKSELFAMLLLDRQDDMPMSQIAEQAGVPMSTATGIINRLVQHGFIHRGTSESDRRVVVIRLTEQGRELVLQFKSRVSEYLQVIERALTPEERGQLFAIATKVVSEIRSIAAASNPSTENERPQLKKIQIE